MAIWLPRRDSWEKQPDNPALVNRSNPLTRGLKAAVQFGFAGDQVYNAVDRRLIAPTYDSGFGASARPTPIKGYGIQTYVTSGTIGQGWDCSQYGVYNESEGSLGVVAFCPDPSLANPQYLVSSRDLSPLSDRLYFVFDTAGRMLYQVGAGTVYTSSAYGNNATVTVSCGWSGGHAVRDVFVLDGSIVRDSTATSTNSERNHLFLGAVWNGSTDVIQSFVGVYQLFCMWNRFLSPAEQLQWHKNPWQIFE